MAVRAEGGKDVGVAEGGGLDDGEELVVGEGGEEAAGVVGGELGGGGEEVGLLAVAVVVVPGGLWKEGLEFVRMGKRRITCFSLIPQLDDWVLCRVRQKSNKPRISGDAQYGSNNGLDGHAETKQGQLGRSP
ncbi:hypothetical protein RHGRI_015039 [Rhododendron griersonianum]|uniref:Uncharacterized protein n=1 Tax=Rhododendron griersonianum TaxID=479676 RepID=A0AAV6KBR7_9ERIC|nr:hypothetical protein RHGRI_015039 [Rhododendron griersonianum]